MASLSWQAPPSKFVATSWWQSVTFQTVVVGGKQRVARTMTRNFGYKNALTDIDPVRALEYKDNYENLVGEIDDDLFWANVLLHEVFWRGLAGEKDVNIGGTDLPQGNDVFPGVMKFQGSDIETILGRIDSE